MWALLSLAIGSFGIGMTEFVVMGLLPNIAPGLLPDAVGGEPGATRSRRPAGSSRCTRSASSSAPRPIAGSVAKYPRHRVMIGLALALTVFNALTFVLPTFELVAASRFLAGLPHGAYFGIGALVAADVLGPGKRAQGRRLRAHRPHARERRRRSARHVPRPAGRLARGVHGRHRDLRGRDRVHRALRAAAPRRTRAHAPRGARVSSASARSGSRSASARSASADSSPSTAMSRRWSPRSPGSPEWVVPIVLVLMGVGMTIGNLVGGHLADSTCERTLLGRPRRAGDRARAARTDRAVDLRARLLRLRDGLRLVGAEPDHPDPADGCRGETTSRSPRR